MITSACGELPLDSRTFRTTVADGHVSSFYLSVFAHRARAAFLAIAERLPADSFDARAWPPFKPPSRPSATAAGFFTGWTFPSVCWMMRWRVANADCTSSVGGFFELDRLGMYHIEAHHQPKRKNEPLFRDLKLDHYPKQWCRHARASIRQFRERLRRSGAGMRQRTRRRRRFPARI